MKVIAAVIIIMALVIKVYAFDRLKKRRFHYLIAFVYTTADGDVGQGNIVITQKNRHLKLMDTTTKLINMLGFQSMTITSFTQIDNSQLLDLKKMEAIQSITDSFLSDESED